MQHWKAGMGQETRASRSNHRHFNPVISHRDTCRKSPQIHNYTAVWWLTPLDSIHARTGVCLQDQIPKHCRFWSNLINKQKSSALKLCSNCVTWSKKIVVRVQYVLWSPSRLINLFLKRQWGWGGRYFEEMGNGRLEVTNHQLTPCGSTCDML